MLEESVFVNKDRFYFIKFKTNICFFYSYKRYKNVYIKLLLFGNHLKKSLRNYLYIKVILQGFLYNLSFIG